MHELLSVKQKYETDSSAQVRGISGLTLMENAGRAFCSALDEYCKEKKRICVLCGPGKNGGDGFAIARILAEKGHSLRVGTVFPVSTLRGDSCIMASRWSGEVLSLSADIFNDAEIIVDAIFGIGLSKPVEGVLATIIDSVNARTDSMVVAVDIPSGLHGDSGAVLGTAISADLTVTFSRKMPGHLLMPGKSLCGKIIVADIGIPEESLSLVEPVSFENTPDLWLSLFPLPSIDLHKYKRGHAVITSGDSISTGAARLAARAALRIGAGVVTVASPSSALAINASCLTSIMLSPVDSAQDMSTFLLDRRRNAVLLGPGNGVGKLTQKKCQAALESHASCVFDADALTSFADSPLLLYKYIKAYPERTVILTPHEGEFCSIFPSLPDNMDKRKRTHAAAVLSGAIIILKGTDTVIAAPDGRTVINSNAPPTLATAGSGDVLAGILCGLLAQGMLAFEAACAAVWLHGEAANLFGPGLISEDLPEKIPQVLRFLLQSKKKSFSLLHRDSSL